MEIIDYNAIGKSKLSIKGPIFEMKTQTTGRKVNSRLWAIPGVKFMFIWNKTGFYVKQRCKHSGKLSSTKYLKCSIKLFLNLFSATKTMLSLKPNFTCKTQKS